MRASGRHDVAPECLAVALTLLISTILPLDARGEDPTPERRHLVQVKGGYALEGTSYALTKRQLWTELGEPDQFERYRRQRIWAGVSMAPGIAAVTAGFVWLLLLVDARCFNRDESDERLDEICNEPATRPELAAFGLVFGGILLTAPGAVWMDKERRVLRRKVELHNRDLHQRPLALPQIQCGRPTARGRGFGARLTWRF